MAYGGIIGQGVDIGSSLDVGLYCWVQYNTEIFEVRSSSTSGNFTSSVTIRYSDQLTYSANGSASLSNYSTMSAGSLTTNLRNKYFSVSEDSYSTLKYCTTVATINNTMSWVTIYSSPKITNYVTTLYNTDANAYPKGYSNGYFYSFLGKVGSAQSVTGIYTGDGSSYREINVGFTPRAVLVVKTDYFYFNDQTSNRPCYSGLALFGVPYRLFYLYEAQATVEDYNYNSNTEVMNGIKISANGFYVYYGDSTKNSFTNESNKNYIYIAYK